MTQEGTRGAGGQQYCANCGEAIGADVRFCPHCGSATGTQISSRSPVATGQKRTGHIKYRNMFVQVILVIITLGIYTIYWYYVTLDELHKANGRTEGAGMWTVLSVIPIASLFAQWHHAFEYAEFIDDKYPGIAIFILWILFSPAVWFLVQMDLNAAARQQS